MAQEDALDMLDEIAKAERQSAEAERARVVAWLRAQEELAISDAESHSDHEAAIFYGGRANGYGNAADAIEAGAHLPAPGGGD